MTGKELQKTLLRGENIEDVRKEIIWLIAVTEEDVEKAALETGRGDALKSEDRELFLKRIRQDPAPQELEKKMRRKLRGAAKKYLPENETGEMGEESWSFLGCDFPDQMD